MRLSLLLPAFLPFALLACSAEDGSSTATEDDNLDTSGCSGVEQSASDGSIRVSAARPPTSSCWNIDSAGFALDYSWSQTNDASPQWTKIGFWISVNGADTFVAADSHECEPAASGGLGHDTSGTQRFTCTARKQLSFGSNAALKAASYGADGRRLPWSVKLAVARDDGSWDSQGGANYKFSF